MCAMVLSPWDGCVSVSIQLMGCLLSSIQTPLFGMTSLRRISPFFALPVSLAAALCAQPSICLCYYSVLGYSVATPAPATTKPLHTTDSIETTSANSWNTSGWGPWRKWRQCYPSPVEEAPSCGPLSGQQKRVRRCLINGRCKGARNLLRSCEFRKCKRKLHREIYSSGSIAGCNLQN